MPQGRQSIRWAGQGRPCSLQGGGQGAAASIPRCLAYPALEFLQHCFVCFGSCGPLERHSMLSKRAVKVIRRSKARCRSFRQTVGRAAPPLGNSTGRTELVEKLLLEKHAFQKTLDFIYSFSLVWSNVPLWGMSENFHHLLRYSCEGKPQNLLPSVCVLLPVRVPAKMSCWSAHHVWFICIQAPECCARAQCQTWSLYSPKALPWKVFPESSPSITSALKNHSHRIAWVENNHNDHLVSSPPLCAGSPIKWLRRLRTQQHFASALVLSMALSEFFWPSPSGQLSCGPSTGAGFSTTSMNQILPPLHLKAGRESTFIAWNEQKELKHLFVFLSWKEQKSEAEQQ